LPENIPVEPEPDNAGGGKVEMQIANFKMQNENNYSLRTKGGYFFICAAVLYYGFCIPEFLKFKL
jgi:hypothetical protein